MTFKPSTRRGSRGRTAGILAIAMVIPLSLAPSGSAVGQTTAQDTLVLFDTSTDTPTDGQPSANAQAALTVSQVTFDSADRVVIARDDGFADALASGFMQSASPLLLVPSDGPLPTAILDQITQLGAEEAVILGGESAVSAAVASELTMMGLTVSRRWGPSRLETATQIAGSEAPDADTVVLARAYPLPGASDPTQAFADSLAAGGLAARIDAPVLLTQTEVLSRPTAEYLQTHPNVRRVMLMGGTAAISQDTQDAVEALGIEVQRVAGPGRADTAVEIAKTQGDEAAASIARVIVTDGAGPNSWAAGFALASHAARFDAPIVLTAAGEVPPATAAFLGSGIAGDPQQAPLITCGISSDQCAQVRLAAQLEPVIPPAFDDIGPLEFDLAGGETQVVSFDGIAGQRVSIGYDRLTSSDGARGCFNIALFAPNDELTRISDSTRNCTDTVNRDGSNRTFTLPLTGVYQLRLKAIDGPLTGRAYVTGLRTSFIELGGPPQSISIDRPGEVANAIFFGRVGQQVTMSYENLAATYQQACIELELYAPNRRTLREIDDPTLNCVGASTADSIAPVRLPVTGLYVLEANIVEGRVGSVDIQVTTPNEP